MKEKSKIEKQIFKRLTSIQITLIYFFLGVFSVIFINYVLPNLFEGVDNYIYMRKVLDWILLIFTSSILIFIYQKGVNNVRDSQRALLKSQERYDLVVKGASEGIWEWALETNTIFFSASWKEILGFKPNEFTNSLEEWFNRVHADDIEKLNLDLDNHTNQQTPFFENEHRILHKDGTYHWIACRGQAQYDENEKAIRMAGSMRDITESKEYERNLYESESRSRAIVETAVDGIITINEHGNIELFNPAAEKIFGYSQDEVIGNGFNMLMASPYYDENDDYFVPKDIKAIGSSREVIARKKDGTVFPVDFTINYIQLGYKHLFVGVIRDITTDKQTEEQIRELSRRIITIQEEERSRIAKDMHDELGQALSALKIMINSTFSTNGQPKTDKKEVQLKIQDYLDKIIERTRILSHSLSPIGLKNIGLTLAIKRLAETFSMGGQLHIESDIKNIDKYFEEGWDTNVYRIIQEALTNIIKHANAKKIAINSKNTRYKLILKIKDDGKGYFIDKSSKSSGIGIMIMHERSLLAGGKLTIHSKPGSGTEVEIAIPKR